MRAATRNLNLRGISHPRPCQPRADFRGNVNVNGLRLAAVTQDKVRRLPEDRFDAIRKPLHFMGIALRPDFDWRRHRSKQGCTKQDCDGCRHL